MFRIKICGITTPGDALLAAEAGADAIGLNFYPNSPRFVQADRAAEIIDALRADYSAQQVQVFAVFVNASLDDILWTIRDANLYGVEQGVGIQLHGDEPPELLRDLNQQGVGRTGELLQVLGHVPDMPVMRAFRCRSSDFSEQAAYLQKCEQQGALPQAVLLDAFAPSAYGGTSETVDWSAVAANRGQLHGLPLALAGGLTPENIAEAIRLAQPDAVDVASGVESTAGRKDAAKVYAFVAAATNAFNLRQLD